MTTDEIRALEPNARRRLKQFADCFKRAQVFDYFVNYSLGLLAHFDRKSIEPIALWIGAAVRTLQLFLSQFAWDHARIESRLRRAIVEEYGSDNAIGVIDGSAHAKQGDKTPGVQRQWCGESGKIDNCVVGQHLIYTDNDPKNPFSACIASDVYLPESWINDPLRRKEAHIPQEAVFPHQVADCGGPGGRLPRRRRAFFLDHLRRRIHVGPGVRVPHGPHRPTRDRRGSQQLPLLGDAAGVPQFASRARLEAGRQPLPLQPRLLQAAVAANAHQGHHPRRMRVGGQGRQGSTW